MNSSCLTRSRTSFAADRMSRRSESICRGALGRCTLTTTSSPFGSVARCTCPIEAAATGRSSKLEKRPLDRQAELLLDDLCDLVERHRGDVVLELAQLLDDVGGHQVGPRREELAELDERRPELVEHLAQPAPAVGELRVTAALAAVERVSEAVPRRDSADLGEPRDAPLGSGSNGHG